MKMDIFKSIKRNNIQIAALCFLILIVVVPFVILSINNRSDNEVFYGNLLGGACLIIAPAIFLTRSIIFIIKPEKSDIIQLYGGIEKLDKILDEINNTIEYQDKQIIVSRNYILDKNIIENLIERKDIINVQKWEYRKSGILCAYRLVITNKYGGNTQYHYKLGEEGKVDYLVDWLGSECKRGDIHNN